MNDIYNQCISMAAWFTESQCKHLPKVLVPRDLYNLHLRDIKGIVSHCPPFKVEPYDGEFIITIPDET
jgi:hypothetical protein